MDIDNTERLSCIQGGKPTGSRAVLRIHELMPGERQTVRILAEGVEKLSINGWSERVGEISEIYAFDEFVEKEG